MIRYALILAMFLAAGCAHQPSPAENTLAEMQAAVAKHRADEAARAKAKEQMDAEWYWWRHRMDEPPRTIEAVK